MRKLLLLTVATLSLASFAQKRPEVRPADQKIVFGEEDVIEADLNKPDVEYFKGRSTVPHASLLKIREEFKEKVMASASDL